MPESNYYNPVIEGEESEFRDSVNAQEQQPDSEKPADGINTDTQSDGADAGIQDGQGVLPQELEEMESDL